jgi:two-component system, chemotaxis family, CheB/CheR fusion protein
MPQDRDEKGQARESASASSPADPAGGEVGVPDRSSSPPAETAPFPVVAIGASAGGLEALRRLFGSLPDGLRSAFVVIQHLDPDRPSLLSHVIEGLTNLPVAEAADGVRLDPGHVYVIPAGADLTIRGGTVSLLRRENTGGLHLPIDTFFRALAEDKEERAIGVVLSGSGADGREGLRAIKAEGGIAIAQEPASAQFRSMPESAIAAGVVDFCGSPEEIAGELARLCHHPYLEGSAGGEGHAVQPADASTGLGRIFVLLRKHAGVDFAGYKRTTILRRIDRRMALRRVGALDDYAGILSVDPSEARALAEDMLIHVTSFFRDPDAFVALKEQAFLPLAERKAARGSIRIWVPGCSTGEEVYSIAICLLESLDDQATDYSIKVFGSDLSEQAIQTARAGVYSEAAVAEIAPARLSRFFEPFEGSHRIGKGVRDLCVFAKHDVTRDPPFAKLDLISCRNVLIYFDTEVQRRVIPALHTCLNERGYLFLGKSETIGGFRDLFAPVEKEQRIFVKVGEGQPLAHPFSPHPDREAPHQPSAVRRRPAFEAERQADYLLLGRYAPPAVIVDERLDIVQFRGRTGRYLEPAPGQPQANLLRMAHENLVVHLHEALERAKAQSVTVRKEGLRIRSGSGRRDVSLEVVPLAGLPHATERYFLVLFEEAGGRGPALEGGSAPSRRVPAPSDEGTADADFLRAELASTKGYLQTLIADHQATIDELGAANEELIAANEELLSTNEELQSAKEELQSTNEELTTVNDQLESRNKELDRIASDLANVLASVETPVIIVDLDLRVRRFTPTVREIARFIPEDLGRPLEDLRLNIQVDDLPRRIREVIRSLALTEREVLGQDGRWFRMSIRPYHTVDNRLEGAILSFADIDLLKRTLDDAEGARDYAKSIVETVTAALVVVDADTSVVSANGAFYDRFGLSPTTAEGQRLDVLDAGLWEQPDARHALDALVAGSQPFTNVELRTELPRTGRAVFFLSGRPILRGGGPPLFLLALEDATTLRALEAERAQLLEAEKRARLEAERANRTKDLFLATLSHELRTPLSTILMSADILNRSATDDQRIRRASEAVERAARAQARLIDDLLDVSRIISGKLLLEFGPVDLQAAVQEAVDNARPSAEAKALDLAVAIDDPIGTVYGDNGRLQQIVNNLLSNAIKFTPHGGHVVVRLERLAGRARLTVADTGIGIRPEVLPQLFGRFVQADSSVTRTQGGLGLGLSIVRHLVEVHGGTVQAESQGEGHGAAFIVSLPLGSARAERPGVAPTGARDIEGVRVLVVEDDDDTRESYVAALAELGVVVRAESSAAAALAALAEFRPQVILSDIAMPGHDGFSFIQKVRQLRPEEGGRVPAAAVTALATSEDRQRALDAGFQMHVAKPVDAARLAAVIRLLADWKPSVAEGAQK